MAGFTVNGRIINPDIINRIPAKCKGVSYFNPSLILA
jgi:hypothetical protein